MLVLPPELLAALGLQPASDGHGHGSGGEGGMGGDGGGGDGGGGDGGGAWSPPTKDVTAGGWSGTVYTESGIPVSAGVDMTYLDASLAAIGIFPSAPTTPVISQGAPPPPDPYTGSNAPRTNVGSKAVLA